MLALYIIIKKIYYAVRFAARLSLVCLSLIAFSCAGGASNRPTAASPGGAPASVKAGAPARPTVGAIAATAPSRTGTASPVPRPRDSVLKLAPGKGVSVTQVMAPDRFRGFVWKDESGLVYTAGEVNSPPFKEVGALAQSPDGRVAFEMRGAKMGNLLLIQDASHGARTLVLLADYNVATNIELQPDSFIAVEYYDAKNNKRLAYVDHSSEDLTVSAKVPAENMPPKPSWKLSLPERKGFKNADHFDMGGLVAYTQFTVTGFNKLKGSDLLGGPCYFVLARNTGSTSLGPYKHMGAVESRGEGESAVFAFSATVEGQEGSYVVLAKADGSERRFGPYAQLVRRPSLMPEGDAVFDSSGALYFAARENEITRLFKDGEESLRCSKLVGIDFAEGYRFPDGGGTGAPLSCTSPKGPRTTISCAATGAWVLSTASRPIS